MSGFQRPSSKRPTSSGAGSAGGRAVGGGRRRSLVAVGVGVVAVGVFATGCGASAGDDKDPEKRSFALGGRTLTVDSDDSSLELVASDVDKVQVTRWFEGRVAIGGDPKVTWAMEDDTLKLRMHCSGVVADCSAKHRIEVPRDVAVVVRDDDGSVKASGFKDSLNIHTKDGSVRVEDVAGALTLRTDDGSVEATGVDSRRVDVNTRDGSVRLDLTVVPDRVSARGDDGSLTIGLPDATYRVTTGTDDGAVDVSVPRDERSSHVVSAHTKDGKVTVRTAN
ncbi:DUF4097 family beta strand repeat-containing protein [Streptomyces sp. IB201691-2A2]|uniref:DUF4097 family beta strand repeat-containing protein n=1 Tax=Streptomyces sp. IB201691-2A2 TaxID=2561920 RepID=UPI00117E3AD0|nr:DUF4097 family beta strand repeat-containing protein [Streptomyces sp. IB201691-2A2]TRO69317.1 hypothetical protein E4K73_01230 [Streptomyces sp. IB201691-2A2]